MNQESSLLPSEGQSENIYPSSIFNIILEKQETVQLTSIPGVPVSKLLTWESADDTIAAVNDIGVVTALEVGETDIHVESPILQFEDYIGIKVVEQGEASRLRLAVELRVDGLVRLALRTMENPVWQSLDNSVAAILPTGEVIGMSEGIALITATYHEEVAVIYVIVKKANDPEIIEPIETNQVTHYSGFTQDLEGDNTNGNGEVNKVLITIPFKGTFTNPEVIIEGLFSIQTGSSQVSLEDLEVKLVTRGYAILEGTLTDPYPINTPAVLILNDRGSKITIQEQGGL